MKPVLDLAQALIPAIPREREHIHLAGVAARPAHRQDLRTGAEQVLDPQLVGCAAYIPYLFDHAERYGGGMNMVKNEYRTNMPVGKLPEKLTGMRIEENARNLSNKIARAGCTAGFFISCLIAIGCH